MTRVRRRRTRARLSGSLTGDERTFLLSGVSWAPSDGLIPFHDRVGCVLTLDEQSARAAWQAASDGLIAEAAAEGLIPWAGREFDGMAGAVSPYEAIDWAQIWREQGR